MIALWISAVTLAQAEAPLRSDLRDLQAFITFVKRLHPNLAGGARVTAAMGSLDGRETSALIDLTLAVDRPEQAASASHSAPEKVLGGVARYTADGHLKTYSGATTAGDLRFERLKAEFGTARRDGPELRNAIRALGARYVDSPPTVQTCPNLRFTVAAVGSSLAPAKARSPFAGESVVSDLQRTELAWEVEIPARQEGVAKRFRIVVDPWGEVLVVGRYGEAWP